MSAVRSPNEDRRLRPDRDAEVVRAWELHRSGATVRQVAAELGCAVSTAQARIKEADELLALGDALDVDRARSRSAASLDHWQQIMESGIKTGEHTPLQAVPVLLKIDERRARLLGLDAATRIRVEPDRDSPGPTPNLPLLAALRDAVTDHERRTREFEEADGLDEMGASA